MAYEAHSVEAEKVYHDLRSLLESDRARLTSLTTQLAQQKAAYSAAARESAEFRKAIEDIRGVVGGSGCPGVVEEVKKVRESQVELMGRVEGLLVQIAGQHTPLSSGVKKDKLRAAAAVELQVGIFHGVIRFDIVFLGCTDFRFFIRLCFCLGGVLVEGGFDAKARDY